MTPEFSWQLLTRAYLAEPLMAESSERPAARRVRVLGRPALLVAGEEGARLFYDTELMSRQGAVPAPLSDEVFGVGTIHSLDGSAHRHRKAIHLQSLDDAGVVAVREQVVRSWRERIDRDGEQVPEQLFCSLSEVLGVAAARWAGLGDVDAIRRSRDLTAIVEGLGSPTRYLRGRLARRRCEAWAAEAVRAARRRVEGSAPVDVVASAVDDQGRLLPVEVAAVELLNLIRPQVAVAYFGAFVPLALRTRPDWVERVGSGGDALSCRAFGHEIRRHYPFVPMLAARAREDLTWHGHHVRRSERVLLQVVATNHDPGRWDHPWSFRPERFLGYEPAPYEFVPQGGGDVEHGHRCPGEPAVVEVLDVLVRELADLPHRRGPLRFVATRIPARPSA